MFAILCNSKLAFVLVCNTWWYTFDTLTPLFKSHATNSKVSAVTPWYLNPPVSVIIPANIHVPISFVISIPKYSKITNKICAHAGASGLT